MSHLQRSVATVGKKMFYALCCLCLSDSHNVPLLAAWGRIQLEWFRGSSVLWHLQSSRRCLPVSTTDLLIRFPSPMFACLSCVSELCRVGSYTMWTLSRCFPEVLLGKYAFCLCVSVLGRCVESCWLDGPPPHLPAAVAHLLSLLSSRLAGPELPQRLLLHTARISSPTSLSWFLYLMGSSGHAPSKEISHLLFYPLENLDSHGEIKDCGMTEKNRFQKLGGENRVIIGDCGQTEVSL